VLVVFAKADGAAHEEAVREEVVREEVTEINHREVYSGGVTA